MFTGCGARSKHTAVRLTCERDARGVNVGPVAQERDNGRHHVPPVGLETDLLLAAGSVLAGTWGGQVLLVYSVP